jgi:hypothetical protein
VFGVVNFAFFSEFVGGVLGISNSHLVVRDVWKGEITENGVRTTV